MKGSDEVLLGKNNESKCTSEGRVNEDWEEKVAEGGFDQVLTTQRKHLRIGEGGGEKSSPLHQKEAHKLERMTKGKFGPKSGQFAESCE